MEVSLRVTRPKGGTKTYKVSKSEVVVGRGKDCDMQILSTEVSRQHCRLAIGDEQVTVQDLGSANGTNVNGVPITAKQAIALVPDSLIEIGPLKIVVKFEPPAKVIDGSSTMPTTQDGTVVNAAPPAEADPQTTPFDEETLPEMAPVAATTPATDDEELDPQALETHDEVDGEVLFDMTAVPEGMEAVDDEADMMELEPLEEAAPDAEAPVAAPAAIEPEPVPDAAPEPAEDQRKPSGLKSLFGVLGKGRKKSDEDASAEPAVAAAPAAPAPAVAPSVEPVAEAPVAPVADVPVAAEAADELEGIDEEELDGLLEELEEEYDEDELQALLAGEDLDQTETPAASPAPQPPADPGLNDFLNQMGGGQ